MATCIAAWPGDPRVAGAIAAAAGSHAAGLAVVGDVATASRVATNAIDAIAAGAFAVISTRDSVCFARHAGSTLTRARATITGGAVGHRSARIAATGTVADFSGRALLEIITARAPRGEVVVTRRTGSSGAVADGSQVASVDGSRADQGVSEQNRGTRAVGGGAHGHAACFTIGGVSPAAGIIAADAVNAGESQRAFTGLAGFSLRLA